MKIQALFKKAAPAKPVAKSTVKTPKSGTKSTKGWFGGQGGSQVSLEKLYGPDRVLFLPGGLLDRNDLPAYLDGELAGDYGYDPLGLGKDSETVAKYRAYELIHARWAMLAAPGIIIPEGLEANGADIKGGTWFKTIFELADGGTLNYFAVPWGIISNPLTLIPIAVINLGLITAVELYRQRGEGPAGYSPGVGKFDSSVFSGLDKLYPGGPFDPLGLSDDPEVFQELKVKEIKNGRLAMVSVLAFWIQSAVTGAGPYANLSAHLSDPFANNLLTVLGSEERVPVL